MDIFDIIGIAKQEAIKAIPQGLLPLWPTPLEWERIFQLESDRKELLRPCVAPADTLLRPSSENPADGKDLLRMVP